MKKDHENKDLEIGLIVICIMEWFLVIPALMEFLWVIARWKIASNTDTTLVYGPPLDEMHLLKFVLLALILISETFSPLDLNVKGIFMIAQTYTNMRFVAWNLKMLQSLDSNSLLDSWVDLRFDNITSKPDEFIILSLSP